MKQPLAPHAVRSDAAIIEPPQPSLGSPLALGIREIAAMAQIIQLTVKLIGGGGPGWRQGTKKEKVNTPINVIL